MTIDAELIISKLGCWQGSIELEPLEGGITNHNYLVHDKGDSRKYVVRLGGDIPVHHISRKKEVAAATAAHHAGLSPRIIHAETGVLVMDYITGRTLTPENIRERAQLSDIIQVIRCCHREVPGKLRGSAPMFWVFQVVRDYALSLEAGNSTHLAKIPELLKTNNELENAAAPFDIVFGHNDLLAGNFLHDGERLWLIDWEYAGFNTPLFDLGGLASNNEFQESDERWLLETYFDFPLSEELWKQYLAMKTASLLRETMWSMISEIHSTIDFDYSSYSAENYSRFKEALNVFRSIT